MPGLDHAVRKVARELSCADSALDRVALAILPVQANLDGLHFVWRQTDPNELELYKPSHAFLNEAEHKLSPLSEVVNTGEPLRICQRAQAARFPFVEGLFADGVTDYVALPLQTRRGITHVFSAATRRVGGWGPNVVDHLRGFSPALALVAESFEVQRLLDEKETLQLEVHHRVKNNLQLVSSMLMMQAPTLHSEEARDALQDSVNRIRSMALIHDQLYGMDSLATINFGAYVNSLAASVQRTLAPKLVLKVDAETVYLAVNVAVPLALILNELLTNAFKYGGVDGPAPTPLAGDGAAWDVRVTLRTDSEGVRLRVEDNGPGLPDEWGDDQTGSLGTLLINNLTRQIRGRVVASRGERGGACIDVNIENTSLRLGRLRSETECVGDS